MRPVPLLSQTGDSRSFFKEGAAFLLDIFDPIDAHKHAIETWACNDTIQTGCTESNLFNNGLMYANAPTGFWSTILGYPTRTEPVRDGEVNFAYPVGWVTTFVFPDQFAILNVTTPDHVLWPGTVRRQIVRRGRDLYIQTSGHGFGAGADLNDILAPIAWDSVDHALLNRVDLFPRTR